MRYADLAGRTAAIDYQSLVRRLGETASLRQAKQLILQSCLLADRKWRRLVGSARCSLKRFQRSEAAAER